MLSSIVAPLSLAAIAVYGWLKFRQNRVYRQLAVLQKDLIDQYESRLEFTSFNNAELPSFQNRLATIPQFLPEATFQQLLDSLPRQRRVKRSYFPGHKQGGTISYEELHHTAPLLVALYQSRYLQALCSAITGERLRPTPLHDQSSCSLLCYEKPQDHIGWHYDYNFYNGRHFTVLLPIVNRHNQRDQLSSAQLMVRQNGQEVRVPTPPNTLIIFEGAQVFHKVTRLGEDETRIILSMTYCADPRTSLVKSTLRRFKDIAYYGIRALWT
jgi:hypothetical protein